MISLFIDTSLSNVSISVIKDNEILSLIRKDIPNLHSVYATSFVKDALDYAKIDANQVDNIYVVNGPGSFTGLRIGVTIAKTYGYLIKKEIIPVSTLKGLALSVNDKKLIMSIIPANKNNYYVGIYNDKYEDIINEKFASRNEILELIDKYQPYVVGINQDIIGNTKINKLEMDILKIINYYKDSDKVNYHKLVPNYLKLPQAVEDKK
ncbi:MAG: tRNA (adenosine(37)-N6)-threonylcarbamoyltransferase complex dimerization subunit type 1 TsaB [Bacilli bacterium]|nr:tRNA (adenosine(37)-N6)-threonylcarbamoyltransferase complex dimerization subunit type 1 TsaB [Bacilli bacterium]